MSTVIKFENVSKKYKLYSKGGLYLRDRITHALQRFNPLNGVQHSAVSDQASVSDTRHPSPVTVHPLERDFWALKDVSFEIKQGESVGFIGRNGAGKSTILKLLAGVTKASSGTVEVSGKVAAMIEVGAGFHPELTGRENVFLNGSILGMTKAEIEKQFDSIVAFAELEEFIDTPVKHYSSGMYVRLGFAIAAHTNPDIYLIDEVLSVGDEAFQKKCLDTLTAHKAAGKTMILVSHSLDKVKDICDRCIYVRHGTLRFDGAPKDAIAEYRLDIAGIPSSQSKPSSAESASRVVGKESGARTELVQNNNCSQLPDIHSIPCDKNRGEGYVLHVRSDAREIIAACGDPIMLEFEIEAPSSITETTVGVTITGLSGEPVISMSSKVQNVPKSTEFSKHWKIVCNMGSIPLNAGTYFTRIYIGNGQVDYARFSDVFALRISPRDVFGWGRHLPPVETWGPTFWAPEWGIEPFQAGRRDS